MLSDLDISVLMQYNKDISIESHIPIPQSLCSLGIIWYLPRSVSKLWADIWNVDRVLRNLSFSTTWRYFSHLNSDLKFLNNIQAFINCLFVHTNVAENGPEYGL